MSLPNRYLYWTGSVASDFGPIITGSSNITGSIIIEYKPVTGTMINPAIRFRPTSDFYTPPSGTVIGGNDSSYVLVKCTSGLPTRFQFSLTKIASNLPTKQQNNYPSFVLGFLFAANDVDQSNVNELCGYGFFNWHNDSAQAFVVDNGIFRKQANFTTLGWGLQSPQKFNFDIEQNSLYGQYIGGMDFNMVAHRRSLVYTSDRRVMLGTRASPLGPQILVPTPSFWEGKLCNSFYLVFANYYSGAIDTTNTGSFIEFDNMAISAHSMGPRQHVYQATPLTTSVVTSYADPSELSGMTWWGITDVANLTVASGSITQFRKVSGSANISFGHHTSNAPKTGSFTGGYLAIHSSGVLGRLSSSVAVSQFIASDQFRVNIVGRIIHATLASANRWTNHAILRDSNGGYFGVYFRHNSLKNNAIIDCYMWDGVQRVVSLETEYGSDFLLEYYKEGATISAILNNTTSGSVAVGNISNTSYLFEIGAGTGEFLLREMIIYNQSGSSLHGLGVSNYLAGKYGFPTGSRVVFLGGERW